MNKYIDMDLEDLIKENIKLTKQNNKLLKKMHRARLFNFWFRILFFVIISFGAWFVYKNYLEGYMTELQGMYNNLQTDIENVKSIPDKLHL